MNVHNFELKRCVSIVHQQMQCKKYGVRALPKKTMIKVLRNIYYGTHPSKTLVLILLSTITVMAY
jgi:hypothetical protein